MKRSIALALTLLCLGGSTAAFADYCINKDFTNTGTVPAYGIGIVITTNQVLTSLYNGFAPGPLPPSSSVSAGIFTSFSSIYQGANELLRWTDLNEAHGPINPGVLVHVGWCAANPTSIVNVYWTDASGNPLAGSIIQETGSEPNGFGLVWANAFAIGTYAAVVGNVRYALAAGPLPLEQLNGQNKELAAELQPLPGPATYTIPPGSKVTAPVPGAGAGQWIVAVYDVNGNGSGATTTDYVQFQFPQ